MSVDQLPLIPETELIEPIYQCGVLYLGSGPPTPGHRGLDSIQEPFSHRYPIDGTNTVRGIDSILSIYNNGIQLKFVRQPHVVIFFPLSSLIYCASIRFSIIENNQTSSIDWRFITLDSTENISNNKHPPLFCLVIQRTNIYLGDECHCFITKTNNSSLTLVRIISEIYEKLKINNLIIRSPIFYQLDRYDRKISEITGIIYLSPANSNEINKNILFDSSLDGFFYRTDTIVIEQWQLWDDDDDNTRPRPPDSPFGQRKGIYHDDLTDEIHKYLKQMNIDTDSTTSSSNSSIECYKKSKIKSNIKQFNSSFDTSLLIKKSPIVIEKILPNPMIIKPQQLKENTSTPYSDIYQTNEYGEKITKNGNRVIFTDVIQPNIELKSKKHRKHSKHIPVIDLQSIENLFQQKKTNHSDDDDDDDLSTSNMLEIVEGYFEDYKGQKLNLNNHDAQTILNHLELSSKKKYRKNNKLYHHHQRTSSILTSGPTINYVEHSPISNTEKVHQYISNIYGTTKQLSQSSSTINQSESQISNNNNKIISTTNSDYISPFRYIQSSINPLLVREYRNRLN